MHMTLTVNQLAAQVRSGHPGAMQNYVRQLQPHMERMLRRAMSSPSQAPMDVALRRAAAGAGGDIAAAAAALCRDSAARLDPERADAVDGTQLVQAGAAWHAATTLA